MAYKVTLTFQKNDDKPWAFLETQPYPIDQSIEKMKQAVGIESDWSNLSLVSNTTATVVKEFATRADANKYVIGILAYSSKNEDVIDPVTVLMDAAHPGWTDRFSLEEI